MTKELESELAEYLGHLLFQRDNCNDWMERENIVSRINAVHVLLDIDSRQKSFMESMQEAISKGFENMGKKL